jgi:shikimate dehydrogenase
MLRTLVPSLNGLRPLVIGAGHAARSVVYALARQGLPVTIVNQRMDEAVDLVHRLRHVMDEHSYSIYRWPQDLARVAGEVNLVINATPLGAWPDVDTSAWPASVPFPSDALAFDLVSWPSDTRFVRQARASGARTVGGLTLLVYGAALAIEQWTGEVPPIELMWHPAEKVLAQHMSWEELTYPARDLAQPT